MPFATADSCEPRGLSVLLSQPSTSQRYIIKVRVFPLGLHAHPSCAQRHQAKQASRFFLSFRLLSPLSVLSFLSRLSVLESYTPCGYCILTVLVCGPVGRSMIDGTSPARGVPAVGELLECRLLVLFLYSSGSGPFFFFRS